MTHYCGDVREVKLFKNRQNQALRIPMDFAFSAERVRIWRNGDALVIEPIYENGLVSLLDSWQPLEDDFPEIPDAQVTSEDVF